ncbi:MAG: hypothetical protein ABIM60_03175 [candidate division WOR-3 bacterium]
MFTFTVSKLNGETIENKNDEKFKPLSIYFEFGGQGGPLLSLSINGDYRITPSSTVRIGVGAWGFYNVGYVYIFSLNSLQSLCSQGSPHNLEISMGFSYCVTVWEWEGKEILLQPGMGYRYQPWKGGIMFRITCVLFFFAGWMFYPQGGLSLGYCF